MKSKSYHCYILCCHLSLIYWLHMPHRYHSYTHSTLKSQSLKAQGAAIGDANLCRQRRRGPSLLMAVAKTIWKPMAVSAVLKLAQDLLGFVSPQILRFVDHANLESRWSIQYKLCRQLHLTCHFKQWKQYNLLPSLIPITFCRLLINFASKSEEPAWKGYLYAVLLFAVAFTQAVLLQQHFIRVYTAGMRVRTAIIAAVYNKVIRERWRDIHIPSVSSACMTANTLSSDIWAN